MDIFDLDLGSAAEEGSFLIPKHPTNGEELTYTDSMGNVKPIRIFLKGSDSKSFRDRMDYHIRKNGTGNQKQQSLAEMEDQNSDLMAAVTTGWEGIFWQVDGQKTLLEFSRINAKMIYKARPWLRRQVDEFVAEAENFFNTNSNN